MSVKGRNPVFALEMIQTKNYAGVENKPLEEVAIQYSPWR